MSSLGEAEPSPPFVDVAAKVYIMHSNALGRVGDFVLVPTSEGLTCEIPAGPVTVRYTAVVKDGT
jgi:hypothetical protein